MVLFVLSAKSQLTFVSTCGYSVTVNATPIEVVRPTNCQWGYNYDLRFNYTITINGTIPNGSCGGNGTLNTLQVEFTCLTNRISGFYSLPQQGTSSSGTAVTTTNQSVPHNGSSNGYNAPFVHCTNATPQNFNCISMRVIIGGPGIPSTSATGPISYPSPLPIELNYFNGENSNGKNLLSWQTLSERENDFFTIERSTDGTFFDAIGTVNGAGNSSQAIDYSFTDEQPIAGTSYYRLKQTDYNGEEETFQPIAIETKTESTQITQFFPNPSKTRNVQLKLNDSAIQSVEVRMYSLQGQLIQSENLNVSNQQVNLDIPNNGNVFLIEVYATSEIIGRHKLVIQD